MCNQFVPAREQNDISCRNLPHVSPFDKKNVTRPYRRKHAQPRHFQAQRAKCPQDLRSHFALQRVLPVSHVKPVLRHDNFLFIVHEACVAFTLPQDNAEVTKTRS